MLSLYLFFLSHVEKITTWQDPRKPMNQPLNHVSHRPATTSTPVPQRSMAMSQPNLSEYWMASLWWTCKRDQRDTSWFVCQSNFWFKKVPLILLLDLTVCSPLHLLHFPLYGLGSKVNMYCLRWSSNISCSILEPPWLSDVVLDIEK